MQDIGKAENAAWAVKEFTIICKKIQPLGGLKSGHNVRTNRRNRKAGCPRPTRERSLFAF
jgi:hypothetical protein